jgi:hypothetical protein
MLNELAQVNLMLFVGLIGMGFGWRGGMRRLHGFYDIAPAIRLVLYGLVLGSFLAYAIDTFIFLPSFILARGGGGDYRSWPVLIITFFVANIASLVTMFLLSRRSVRLNKSAPTSGWAFGLMLGAMISVKLGFQIIRIESGFSIGLVATIAILIFYMPQFEATICCGQGSRGQRGERWLALFWATFWRFFGYMFIVVALISPIWWIFLIPPLMVGISRAEHKWMMDSLTPEAQRRYRRVIAQSAKRERLHQQRQRRWQDSPDSSEE